MISHRPAFTSNGAIYGCTSMKEDNHMENIFFTPLEETISFYTRNDYAIINRFLSGNFDAL